MLHELDWDQDPHREESKDYMLNLLTTWKTEVSISQYEMDKFLLYNGSGLYLVLPVVRYWGLFSTSLMQMCGCIICTVLYRHLI